MILSQLNFSSVDPRRKPDHRHPSFFESALRQWELTGLTHFSLVTLQQWFTFELITATRVKELLALLAQSVITQVPFTGLIFEQVPRHLSVIFSLTALVI